MAPPLLHVDRWHSDYLIARGHPAPERARAALDRAASRLPAELAESLGPWLAAESGVVLIPSLEFDCEVDLADDGGTLATRWACRFARALADALQDSERVMRFASRADYRARFVADLAAGRARGAWYYRPFAGLESLDTAAAIRTVLLEDPARGRDTLLALPREAWRALGDALSEREAARILEGLTVESAEAGDPQRLPTVLRAAHDMAGHDAPVAAHALAIVCTALREGFAPTRTLGAWAGIAARLMALAARDEGVAIAAARGELAAIAESGEASEREAWRTLETRPRWRETLARALAAPSRASAATGFGGLALLLPELDGLLDDALCAALPPHAQVHPRNLAAWMALSLCAGATRATHFRREIFWRDFFGIPNDFGAPDLRTWVEHLDGAPALARLAELAAARSRGATGTAFLRTHGEPAWLRVDEATGIWREWGREADGACDWRARLAAAKGARKDWRYLAVDDGLPLPCQRFFVQLAQIALRRFAYRIPGFARTSLAHLYANFLAAGGGWVAPGRLRLARPPLHALLAFTGISRGPLAWSGPPPLAIEQEYTP